LEVADIFRVHGASWRWQQGGHLSLRQPKIMSAIEQCRTAALGGHVLRCERCGTDQVSYNSCRNRHCPKCQSSAAIQWLEARQAHLLPVEYCHVVFTLPAPIADIAYYNKAVIYGLLFDIAVETLLRIGADPKHLGARLGITLVLHTWGSALTHHPHVHGIVRGGDLSLDGQRWIACRPGPEAVLAYLSRYTHRVAISSSRLLTMDERGVTFRWKDYRQGRTRHKTMTLHHPGEFMRRFLLHVLPVGFHRIRHDGLLANGCRRANLALAREMLAVPPELFDVDADDAHIAAVTPTFVCWHCGRALIVLQTFTRGQAIRAPPCREAQS
jgi:hypothetical protein